MKKIKKSDNGHPEEEMMKNPKKPWKTGVRLIKKVWDLKQEKERKSQLLYVNFRYEKV